MHADESGSSLYTLRQTNATEEWGRDTGGRYLRLSFVAGSTVSKTEEPEPGLKSQNGATPPQTVVAVQLSLSTFGSAQLEPPALFNDPRTYQAFLNSKLRAVLADLRRAGSPVLLEVPTSAPWRLAILHAALEAAGCTVKVDTEVCVCA